MTVVLDRSVLCPVPIGRELYLDALEQVIEQVRSGHGRILLVSGEAGIGKSTLIAEARARTAPDRWLILQGHSFEQDQDFPFAPLLALLRARFAARPAAELAEELGQVAPEFAKLLPELTTLLPGLAVPRQLAPEQEKYLLFEALAQYLQRRAAEQPVLMTIEDLHWSDDTTLDFLLYFARRVSGQPLLLLLTYRSDEVTAHLSHFLSELERERLAIEIALPRLTIMQVERMVRTIFDIERPIPQNFLETIYSLTDGNPFFIEELLKSLLSSGDISYTGQEWKLRPVSELQVPRTVRDAVQRRLAGLSEGARELLSIAAVAGERFDFAVLEALTGQDEARLLKGIRELIRAQMVVELSSDDFAFRHALTRQALYTQLLARERRSLHRAIGEAIEQVHESPERHLAQQAYHFYEGGAWEKALTYAWQAGERAQQMYSPRVAVTQFTRALEAAAHLATGPSADLYRARGQAHETLGDFARARADYEASLEAARAADDPCATWQALLDLGLLWASRNYERSGDYYQQALALARHIEDPVTLAHTLNRVGNWRMNLEKPREALRYHEEALALFEAEQDQRGIAQTADLLGMAHTQLGDMRALDYYERAAALFEELDDRYGLVNCLAMLGALRLILGLRNAPPLPPDSDYPAEVMRAISLAQEIGWRAGEVFGLVALFEYLMVRGDYAGGLPLAHQALAVAEEIEHRQWMVASYCTLGEFCLALLALPEARYYCEQALALAQESGSMLWTHYATGVFALTAIQQGELALAASLLDKVQASQELETASQRLCAYVRAQLTLVEGQPERARALLDRVLDAAPNDWRWPRFQLARGELLMELGELEAAEQALQETRGVVRNICCNAILWRVDLALAQLYRRQKRHDEAEEALASARALVESVAATVPDAKLGATFRQRASEMIPASLPRTPRQKAKQKFDGLTRRERQVAVQVAHGRTNREIAEELVISQRTVESHVSNIMAKLGCNARTQIAIWASEKGLLEEDDRRSLR